MSKHRLMAGCPVKPLRIDGDTVTVVNAIGQTVTLEFHEFSYTGLQCLFAPHEGWLRLAFLRLNRFGEVTGFNRDKAVEAIFTAAARRTRKAKVRRKK